MARTGAVFGGEHSAHYYFTDFFRADTGMLAAMHVLAALGEQDGPLSDLAGAYQRYAASGEINSTVTDMPGTLGTIRAWAAAHDADVDELDGRDGQPARRVLVQRPAEQHRAAAAAERRGGRRRRGWQRCATRSLASSAGDRPGGPGR